MRLGPRLTRLIAAGSLLGLLSWPVWGDSARQIEHNVESALTRFRAQVKNAGSLLEQAKAVLVIPKVIQGGSSAGGEYGEGDLRLAERTVAFYGVSATSFGVKLTGEQKDLIVLFFSQDAVKKFRLRSDWVAGVDGKVTVCKSNTAKPSDVNKTGEATLGFVLGAKGLLVEADFQKAKFTLLDK